LIGRTNASTSIVTNGHGYLLFSLLTPLTFKKTLTSRLIQKNNELSFIFSDLFYHLRKFVLDLKFHIFK
jgi:hypothetical protein